MAFTVITSQGVEDFPDPVNPPTYVGSNWCCHATSEELADAGISCCIEEGACMEGFEEFGYAGYGSASGLGPMSMLDYEMSPELKEKCEMLADGDVEQTAIKFHSPSLIPVFTPTS